ncbi:diguanylate cyclase (GGDEF domain) [Sulfurimonas gotlandica GD1]|uniref:diguanylate cyclase n=1 Tax=Sulfurimonas gotlandica (strain DSM 19862 / JCM 16533 / GD1) TaxID=929558 RepID=B6BMK7_SULGG|nr:diguanylate cyclase [Sulfurimonas gotlandica]EDZ61625.1 diguanylate cyclase [Sulfurimonas gotlandica GD1]EHP30878.1 diguanylate cyclase (GGDEF domain) [Sulfurimonas gotlandica GD1]
MFRLNLYFPLMIVTVLMAILTIVAIIYIQENSIHKSKESISRDFNDNLNEKVKLEATILGEYIDFIQNKDDISKLFLEQNKEELNNSIKKIYTRLNKNVDLTHMYFIKADGTVLLRAHEYDRDKDIIDRTTFKKSQENQSLFYGLEFGPKKNYTLRVVKPWFVEGKLIGYIELGKEIDKIINEISTSLKTLIYIAVKKELYANALEFVRNILLTKVQTRDYYIVYNTFTIPKEMEYILNETIINDDISLENSSYFVSKSILSDVSGKELGYFVFLTDVSLEHSVMYGSIKILGTILFILTSGMLIGGYFLIRDRERSIHALTSKLEKQKTGLALFNVKLQKLFDLQKNIVITSNGKTINMANNAMVTFFGFKNINDYLNHHKCICEKFIEDDNFFHLGKVDEGENWIDTIKSLPDEKCIVCMLDYNKKIHSFSVKVSEVEDENYIISFTDISNTMIEHTNLKRKSTHDKLTGALNREFFDNNIKSIIKDMYPEKMGIVLCDIDHFKDVNDTYGHNRGDNVLKEFTTIIKDSIRDSDYLIRWGGEEFIVLMKVNTIDSLQRATEHMRKHIESYKFEEVGTITSSFGITLHIENEKILDTLERVDKALYKAKNNGRNQFQIL